MKATAAVALSSQGQDRPRLILALCTLLALVSDLTLRIFCSSEPIIPGLLDDISLPTPAAGLCAWWDSHGLSAEILFFFTVTLLWIFSYRPASVPSRLRGILRLAEFLVVLATVGLVAATVITFYFYLYLDPNFQE